MDEALPLQDKRIGVGRVPTPALVAVFLLGLCSGLVYLTWWGLQPPGLRSVRLRDGTRVALASVTYGTVHRFDPAPPLLRLARGLRLPTKIPDIATVTCPKPQLRLWFYMRLSESQENWEGFTVFEDEHGCPFDEGQNDPEGWGDGKHMWTSIRPPAALENGRPFDFCAYDSGLRQEVVRFHAEPGISVGPLPIKQALTPRPLPQTTASQGFEATLVSLKAVSTPSKPHYRAIVRGKNAEGAVLTPLSLFVEDRYGQRTEPLDESKRAELHGDGFPFLGLCRREPAWKLIAVMAAEPKPNDHPDESCELTVPTGNSQSQSVHGKRSLVVSEANSIGVRASKGPKLKLADVMVRGSRRLTRNRIAVTRINGLEVSAVVSRLKPGLPDDQRPVLTAELPPAGQWCTLKVPVPIGVSPYHLRIAEYVGHQFEFVVPPPQ